MATRQRHDIDEQPALPKDVSLENCADSLSDILEALPTMRQFYAAHAIPALVAKLSSTSRLDVECAVVKAFEIADAMIDFEEKE